MLGEVGWMWCRMFKSLQLYYTAWYGLFCLHCCCCCSAPYFKTVNPVRLFFLVIGTKKASLQGIAKLQIKPIENHWFKKSGKDLWSPGCLVVCLFFTLSWWDSPSSPWPPSPDKSSQDLPNTMVDLPNTMIDLPNTMEDLPDTMVDLPKLPSKEPCRNQCHR